MVRAAAVPRRIGDYRVIEPIGSGGMAMIYKAVRPGVAGFERPVVVKVIDPAQAADRTMIDLFKSEARVLAMLSHPHIVQVQDFGVDQGALFLVMELLEGRDLLHIMKHAQGPLPPGVVLRIARQLCDGLGYIHNFRDPSGRRRQIIHRDVSPANVMVCGDGTVKLLDFGVAKILADSELNMTRNYRGKFSYMAPELLQGAPFDRRVDVFATGILMWEMLTARRLFFRAHVEDTLNAIESMEIQPPSKLNPRVSPALDVVVMRALERDPERRFRSAGQMAEALDEVRGLDLSRRDFVQQLELASPPPPDSVIIDVSDLAVPEPTFEPTFDSRPTLAAKARPVPPPPPARVPAAPSIPPLPRALPGVSQRTLALLVALWCAVLLLILSFLH
jgi:eukaryotic-like serine/threonine-protein kinase